MMNAKLFLLVSLVCFCQDFVLCRVLRTDTRTVAGSDLCAELRGRVLAGILESMKYDGVKSASTSELLYIYDQVCKKFGESKDKLEQYALRKHNNALRALDKRQVRGGKKRSNVVEDAQIGTQFGMAGEEEFLQAKRQVRGGKRSDSHNRERSKSTFEDAATFLRHLSTDED